MFGIVRVVAQKSSKSANVRDTSIFRVSIFSRPAPAHSCRSNSIRQASTLGGLGGVSPKARISICIAPVGEPSLAISQI